MKEDYALRAETKPSPIICAKATIKRLIRLARNEFLAIRGLKLSLLHRRHNIKKAPIKLWWWRYDGIDGGKENFGDAITGDIIKSIYGRNYIWSPLNQCDMVGVGSIIDAVNEGSDTNLINAWGSGFIRQGKHGANHNIHPWSVRGPLTSKRMECNELVMGDPGILASLVYERSRHKNNKVGVVLHYADANDDLVKKLKGDNRFILINPLNNPQEVAYQITSCKLILSSSLHGLIFADSWKIPNYHIKLSDKVNGGEYKFRDYCGGVGKKYEPADVKKIMDNNYLNKLINDYKPIANLSARQRSIIKAFPYY